MELIHRIRRYRKKVNNIFEKENKLIIVKILLSLDFFYISCDILITLRDIVHREFDMLYISSSMCWFNILAAISQYLGKSNTISFFRWMIDRR